MPEAHSTNPEEQRAADTAGLTLHVRTYARRKHGRSRRTTCRIVQPSTRMLTSGRIKARAQSLGFALCGVAPASAFPELRFLREWIDRGYAGEMRYIARTADRRADVRHVLPTARTVIALGTVYNVDRPYSVEQADPNHAHVARYAWGTDYHAVVGQRTEQLLGWMKDASPDSFEARAYVDTGAPNNAARALVNAE